MALFDSIDETTDKALERGEEFVKATEAYYELKGFQILTATLSLMVKFIMIGALALLTIIFLSLALSHIIGQALNSVALGYVITGGIFLFFAIIIYALRKSIENSIIKNLSIKLFNRR